MIGQKGATRSVRVERYRDGETEGDRDALAVEEPLEIRVAWVEEGARRVEPLAVTMRTPGDDFELVAGFLFGEGIVAEARHLQELTYCRSGEAAQEYNVVEARMRPGITFDPESVRRNFYTTSSCGVCGKASLEAVEVRGCAVMDPGEERVRIPASLASRLPDRLEEGQGVFARTGGLHAAALFDVRGKLLELREDVGRHNAVDKVVGHAFLRRNLPASDRILVVSGRASFEIVQKAVAAGIPVLVAVGAPSSLAVELADRFGQTLVGFARNDRCNVYTHPRRVT